MRNKVKSPPNRILAVLWVYGWTLGSQGAGMAAPVLVSAALVDPQRGGQTTLSASQVAVGSKRLRIVELGTPYKRPMSSSGRLSVDVMMMMMMGL
ncbi:jg6945 [Pararge aegeria aegeria]|uniref:Jg6945 protein n=1 Tax=Pararge aegeria aegeria TaxID=348720 RepID=A0A8S4SAM2_9NEOP|nr:jg6945 [Pararge aegeria aegeria]